MHQPHQTSPSFVQCLLTALGAFMATIKMSNPETTGFTHILPLGIGDKTT
jgi:hypothetical protein